MELFLKPRTMELLRVQTEVLIKLPIFEIEMSRKFSIFSEVFFFFTKSTELFLKPIRNYRTITGANRTVDKTFDF